ncbi:hypothetical protein [Blastococcus sp. TF02A-26]|uniref:hypothetical protein n=1 Tax=Blastococcus sp. TF02A-26 TaxID=2250577 RepID=UPI000DE9945D|nr:hypothetical protein [Blastococcus sp. TF02A-26]RBY84415.1 hypothetical protein DQ240_14975 [Blastococcus sp. TF02A-26]
MEALAGTSGIATAPVDRAERRREAWRRIVVRQVASLCARAQGSDAAAQDAAARAGRLAALLELEEKGVLRAR